MSADICDIASVVEHRASAVERKITSMRKKQSIRQLAIQKLELACKLWERRLREGNLGGSGVTTARCLQETSQEGREQERTLQDLRTRLSSLRADDARDCLKRKAYCDALLGLRRKAEYMHARQAQRLRKEARRRFAHDNVATAPVAIE